MRLNLDLLRFVDCVLCEDVLGGIELINGVKFERRANICGTCNWKLRNWYRAKLIKAAKIHDDEFMKKTKLCENEDCKCGWWEYLDSKYPRPTTYHDTPDPPEHIFVEWLAGELKYIASGKKRKIPGWKASAAIRSERLKRRLKRT